MEKKKISSKRNVFNGRVMMNLEYYEGDNIVETFLSHI